jgi:hypothetical protein
MAGSAPLLPDPDLSQGEVNIVMHHHQLRTRLTIPPYQGGNGMPAGIHVCLGLDQEDGMQTHPTLTTDRLEFVLLHRDIVPAGQSINNVKTEVVTRIPVTPPRIPQPNNYIHTRAINSLA